MAIIARTAIDPSSSEILWNLDDEWRVNQIRRVIAILMTHQNLSEVQPSRIFSNTSMGSSFRSSCGRGIGSRGIEVDQMREQLRLPSAICSDRHETKRRSALQASQRILEIALRDPHFNPEILLPAVESPFPGVAASIADAIGATLKAGAPPESALEVLANRLAKEQHLELPWPACVPRRLLRDIQHPRAMPCYER